MADGKMLQIIIFAILLGFAISHSGEPGKRVADSLMIGTTLYSNLCQLLCSLLLWRFAYCSIR